MARPEGFEPPTNRFEADYSIQLSYGRMGTQCSREANILKPRGSESRPLPADSAGTRFWWAVGARAYRLERNAVWESSSLA